MFVKKPDKVIFINDFLEESFNKLQDNNWLKKSLRKAIEDFTQPPFTVFGVGNEKDAEKFKKLAGNKCQVEILKEE